jgi:DnaJ-class molecular chaperone
MTDLILFLLGTGGSGAWYVWTGHVKRKKPCRACGGYGYTERSGIIGRYPRPCKKCGGHGEVLRLAARHVQRKRAARARRAAGARRTAASTW